MEMEAAVDDPGDDLPMPSSPYVRRGRATTSPIGELSESYQAPALARTITSKMNSLASLFPEERPAQPHTSDGARGGSLGEHILGGSPSHRAGRLATARVSFGDDSRDGSAAPGLDTRLSSAGQIGEQLPVADLNPFGKPTIFSRTTSNVMRQSQPVPSPSSRENNSEDSGAQAAEINAEGDVELQTFTEDGVKAPTAHHEPVPSKGVSETVESCMVIMTAISMGVVLYNLGDVLVPLILAVFVSSMLVPLVDLLTDRPLRACNRYWCNKYWCGPVLNVEKDCMEKKGSEVCSLLTSVITLRLPNVLALLVVLGGLGIVLTASGLLLYHSIEPFVDHAQQYEDSVESIGKFLYRSLNGNDNVTLKEYTMSQLKKQTEADDDGNQGTSSALDLISDGQFQLIALTMLEAVASATGTVALIMMYVIFILLGRQARGQRKGRKVTYAVEHQLKVYVSWKFIISATTGILIGVTLKLLNCDLAVLFGFLVFGLNFIPTVGLLAAVLLPLPLVVLAPRCPDSCWNDGTDHSWPYDKDEFYSHYDSCREASCCGVFHKPPNPPPGPCGGVDYGMTFADKLLAVAIPYLINVIVSNFVEPMVFGKRLNLHPVVVLFALVFWYMMWGLPGAFLSVPIMSVIKILCLNMDNLTAQWFAGLLEGDMEKQGDPHTSELYAYGSSTIAPELLGEGQEDTVCSQAPHRTTSEICSRSLLKSHVDCDQGNSMYVSMSRMSEDETL